jgi:hypothetical protein
MVAPQVLQITPQQILDAVAAQLKRLLNDRLPTCPAGPAAKGGSGMGSVPDADRYARDLPSKTAQGGSGAVGKRADVSFDKVAIIELRSVALFDPAAAESDNSANTEFVVSHP